MLTTASCNFGVVSGKTSDETLSPPKCAVDMLPSAVLSRSSRRGRGFNAGERATYERFAGYVPRTEGTASYTAGPKVAHFDRVEWQSLGDAATLSVIP